MSSITCCRRRREGAVLSASISRDGNRLRPRLAQRRAHHLFYRDRISTSILLLLLSGQGQSPLGSRFGCSEPDPFCPQQATAQQCPDTSPRAPVPKILDPPGREPGAG